MAQRGAGLTHTKVGRKLTSAMVLSKFVNSKSFSNFGNATIPYLNAR